MIAPGFDVESLRIYTIQSFFNSIMCNAQDALHCLQKYLLNDVIKKGKKRVANWKAYFINMAMSYEKGGVEGRPFCLQ